MRPTAAVITRNDSTKIALVASMLCLSLSAGTTSWANDGVFGGTGVNPVPMTSTEVAMVDEIVSLRLDTAKQAWMVDCSFVFENQSDKPVTLTIGFPFPTANSADGDIATPKRAPLPKDGEPLVWGFETRVRGKRVTPRKSKTGINPSQPALEYEFAYLWDVIFSPGESVHIENSYYHGITSVVGGTIWANYVLRTGSTWRGGRIGNARLSVQVPSRRMALCANDVAGGQPVTPEKHHVSPLHGEPGFEVHWNLAEHPPQQDLSVCVQDLDLYAQMKFHSEIADSLVQGRSADELRNMEFELLALHGKPFDDPRLRTHYGHQWWYRADPTFSESKLGKDERDFLKQVRAAQAALGK